MSWSIGGILVAGVTYAYNQRQDEWAWRMPLALQWLFPVSPKFVSYTCRHNADLRRTTITCLMYASQNFAGNLIANQATFFFERK